MMPRRVPFFDSFSPRTVVSVLVALGCVVLYVQLFVRSAHVEIELVSEKRNLFKVYWAGEGEDYAERRMAQAVCEEGRSAVRLRVGDLAAMRRLRVDPAERQDTWVILRRLELRQVGFPSLQLAGPEDLAQLIPRQGIKHIETVEEGLRVQLATQDGQLEWSLPRLTRHLSPLLELVRWGMIALAALGCMRLLGRGEAARAGWVAGSMALVLGLMLAMAMISRNNAHPDEFVHIQAAEYYQGHWWPPRVGDPAIRQTYSDYGVSRLHAGEAYYFIAGKYLQLLAPLQLQSHLALRGLNVLLWAAMLLWVLIRPDARLLALPLLISPQVWYVFSYVNSEALALFVTLVIAWQVTGPETIFARLARGPRWFAAAVALGLLLGLFLLSKKNFYAFSVFLGPYLLWRLRYDDLGPWRLVWRRWAVVGAIGLATAGIFVGVDHAVNWPERGRKIAQAQEEYALPMYKASTPLLEKHVDLRRRSRGISLRHFLQVDRWGEKIFRSSFGVYGYLSVSASFDYYNLMRWLGLGLLAGLGAHIILRGSGAEISLLVITATSITVMVLIVFYQAWVVNFQGQGRYFLPLLPMLAVLVRRTCHPVPPPPVQLGVLAMCVAAVYNYSCVGFQGILVKYGL